jgi:regulator of nonsense transcripts 2
MAIVTGTAEEEENTLPKRLCLRVLTEFVLHGVITDLKPIVKIVSEAAGAPSDDNKEYVVTDANIVVTFAKTGGHEILGVVPKITRVEFERLQKEVTGEGEGKINVVAADGSSEQSDAKLEENTSLDIETHFVPTLSNKLIADAQSVLDSYSSTVPNARAVPKPVSRTLHTHCLGAYRTIANSYLATHRRLLKLEKRCEQDRLLQGNLSESREKGLSDARILLENLKKSVEALSDVLNVDLPSLPKSDEDEENAEATDGKGISLWTKNDTDENLGPFDDEETRAFYCDVPDFLETKPAALLGLNPADLEKQKERNLRQYGGLGGSEESEDVVMEVGDVETTNDLEENEIQAEDATVNDNAEGEAEDGGEN